jgi:putative SOS response-associated peptidase YedK
MPGELPCKSNPLFCLCDACALVEWIIRIHDPENYDLWLDPGMTDVAAASDLLKPYDARAMRWLTRHKSDQLRC